LKPSTIYYSVLLGLFCLFARPPLAAQNCPQQDSSQAFAAFEAAKKAMGQGQAGQAFDQMEKAKSLLAQRGCWENWTRISYNKAIMHKRAGQMQAMKNELRLAQTTALQQLPENDPWQGHIAYLFGRFYMGQGALDTAKLYFLQSRFTYKFAQSWKDYAQASRALAETSLYMQDYRLMERYLDDAFTVTQEQLNNDLPSLRKILQLYGALYYRTGDYESALDRTKTTLEIVKEAMQSRQDSIEVASYYNNIGLLYIEIGDVDKAEDYCRNALNLSSQLGDLFRIANTYTNLAELTRKKAAYSRAYNNFKKAEDALNRMSPKEQAANAAIQARIQLNLGWAEVAWEIGKKKEAFALLAQTENWQKRLRFKTESTFLLYGRFFRLQKDWEQAKNKLDKALEEGQKTYSSGKHPDLARIYLERALLFAQQPKAEIGQALMALEQASEALQMKAGLAATEELSAVSDRELLLEVMEVQIKLYDQAGQEEMAYRLALKAASLAYELRNSFKSEGSRLFLLQRLIPIYEQALAIVYKRYQKQPKTDYLLEAFQLVERSKALLLLEALQTENARAFGGLPKKLLKEERRLSRELAKKRKQYFEAQLANNAAQMDALDKELLALKRESQRLQDTLEANYYDYFRLKYEDKTPSLEQLQKKLDTGERFLEYFSAQDGFYLLALSPNSGELFYLPKGEDFNRKMRNFRLALTNSAWLKEEQKTLALKQLLIAEGWDLYQQFVAPALKAEGIDKILLVPDGLLNYIPFEVLLSEAPAPEEVRQPSFKTLPYLLKRYNVHYHYSAALLLYERPKIKSGRVLGMAPSYAYDAQAHASGTDSRQHHIRSSVDDLPGAKAEIQQLSKAFKGLFLYGQQANETEFKKQISKEEYALIHLAMHGWVDEERPEYSNLVFSHRHDSLEDDLLHAYELNLLKIRANLVVLSACETGFGKYERGEGVVSLGRGFMYAGVPALVMTLWPINDQATAILMQDFYEGLSAGKSKSEALRQAKLNYLDAAGDISSHPFFWASFIELGDDRPIKLSRAGNWKLYLLLTALIILLLGLLARYFRPQSGN